MIETTTYDPDEYILGKSRGAVRLARAEDNRATALRMAQQAKRTLCITSRDLDPALYNTSDFCLVLKHLATRSKYSRIRCLIRSSETLVKDGHCLLELSRRLSSFVQIRCYGKEHMGFNGAFLVADNVGYIDRELSDRYEATADFCDPYKSKALVKQFQAMWDASEADPGLRRLHL